MVLQSHVYSYIKKELGCFESCKKDVRRRCACHTRKVGVSLHCKAPREPSLKWLGNPDSCCRSRQENVWSSTIYIVNRYVIQFVMQHLFFWSYFLCRLTMLLIFSGTSSVKSLLGTFRSLSLLDSPRAFASINFYKSVQISNYSPPLTLSIRTLWENSTRNNHELRHEEPNNEEVSS